MLIHLRGRVYLWEPEEVYRQLDEAGFAEALSFHVSGSFWCHWSSLAYLAGPQFAYDPAVPSPVILYTAIHHLAVQ